MNTNRREYYRWLKFYFDSLRTLPTKPESLATLCFLRLVGVARASRRGRALCKQRGPHYIFAREVANDSGTKQTITNHVSRIT